MPSIFQAPPLTPELLSALKLIAPELEVFDCSEESRETWESSYNLVSLGEYDVLEPILGGITPQRILEIGPGMGRSLVYLNRRCGWEKKNAQVDAYEGDGAITRYTVLGPRFEDSWCGNIGILWDVLKYNHIANISIYNAAVVALRDMPGPYDLIYSFYAVGFHWGLEHFIDDITNLMHDATVGIFMVYRKFEPFLELDRFNWQILDVPGLPDNPKFLVITKL